MLNFFKKISLEMVKRKKSNQASTTNALSSEALIISQNLNVPRGKSQRTIIPPKRFRGTEGEIPDQATEENAIGSPPKISPSKNEIVKNVSQNKRLKTKNVSRLQKHAFHVRRKDSVTILTVNSTTENNPGSSQGRTVHDSSAINSIIRPEQSDIPTGLVVDRNGQDLIIVPIFSLPDDLKKHMEYIGHKYIGGKRKAVYKKCKSPDGRLISKSIVVKCSICMDEVSGHVTTFTNFWTHLEIHGIYPAVNSFQICDPHEDDKGIVTGNSACVYPKHHPKQMAFEQLLLDFVVTSKQPFAVIQNYGLQRLIVNLDKHISIPSKTTLRRRLTDAVKLKAIPSLKQEILEGSSGTLVIDAWTSRSNQSILAIRFIHFDKDMNWNIRTLSVKQTLGHQTAINIRENVREVLDYFNLMHKISFICTDSGANMMAAFRDLVVEENEAFESSQSSVGSIEEQINLSNNDSTFSQSIALELEKCFSQGIFTAMFKDVPHFWQTTCASHALQNCINTVIRKSGVDLLLERMHRTCNFISKRSWAIQRIKHISNGKGLLKKSETRWNFVVDRALRFTEEIIYNEAKAIIAEEHERLKGRLNEIEKLQLKLDTSFRQELLQFVANVQPLAQATDLLQKDQVSCHLVIPTIAEAYHAIEKIQSSNFIEFRTMLLDLLRTQFSSWMSDPAYVIPVILNPSSNLRFFEWYHERYGSIGDPLRIPSKTEAHSIFMHHFSSQNLPSAACNSSSGTVLNSTEPEWMQAMRMSAQSEAASKIDDCIKYIEAPLYFCSIIEYWKTNKDLFKDILPLVQMFLSNPSSTGSVERLFSFLGQQNKKDRGSLNPSTLQELVLWNEHLKPRFQAQPQARERKTVEISGLLQSNSISSLSEENISDVSVDITGLSSSEADLVRNQLSQHAKTSNDQF